MYWGNKKVIAIGGGKGGIGKSCFSANLGLLAAQAGKRVVLVDADLGAANLHTMTGVRYPERTLDDFIKGRQKKLEDTLLTTPYPNLRLLSSASDILSIAAPNYNERRKLYGGIRTLDVDLVVFDIAAGTHTRAVDFFALAPIGVIIVEPTPTSLENAFSFLKNLLIRHLFRTFWTDKKMKEYIQRATDPRNSESLLQFNELLERLETMEPVKIRKFKAMFDKSGMSLNLVANMIRTPEQFQLADRFARIIKRYLTLDISTLGGLPDEPRMDQAIVQRMPFAAKFPDSGYTRGMQQILTNLKL